ncbi:DnaD domain-containing protein [Streptococcus parauberis]|uniref:DnaD domain-containing protein n=1 Tax=Streptococcus parauberis TaxID=1348 RepID=UPI0021A3D70D|nr:DnaD domain protein [Streptococcus parauberis]UWM90547.1 DnaD domain protein [Streptococcus parauberis]
MAQKRMFSNTITDTDRFLDMPASSQNLYFHLNMHADDDGFVDSPKRIMRNIGAGNDDMNVLLTKKFVLNFDSGIILIKDWKIHNVIRKDMYKPSIYTDEKSKIILDDTNSYQLRNESVPQIRLDKNRLDKNRLDEDSEKNISVIISEHCQNHGLFIDGYQLTQLEEYYSIDGMEIEVVCKAITESADNNKRNMKYVLAILRNWKQAGIKTMAQLQDRERQRFEQKNKTNQDSSKKTNVPDWSNSNYEDPDLLSFVLGDNAEVVDDPNAF